MSAIEPVVAHVGSLGLGDSGRPPFDARGASGTVDVLRRTKVTGLALAALQAGDLLLDDQQEAELITTQERLAALALEIDALTLRTLDALGGHGLVVLKGIAHAHLDYPDPSWREYGDVDLLVASDRLAEVESWFARLGFARAFAPFASRWEQRFGKSITLKSDLLEVDLHRVLSQGLALGVDASSVFARRSSFVHAGVEIPTLDAPARLVHAAIHALGGSELPPATGLIDIARMAAVPARLDEAVRLARAWDVSKTLADAVWLAASVVGSAGPSLEAAVTGERGTANERMRRRILGRPGHAFRNDLVAGFLSLRGVRRRARFAASLVADRLDARPELR